MQKGIAPYVAVEQGFALSVNGIESEFLRIGDIRRQKAPEHHLQKAHASRLIPDDDRLHGLRRSIVIGRKLDGQTVNIAEVKGFGNLLLVASPLISAAHDRSLRHSNGVIIDVHCCSPCA